MQIVVVMVDGTDASPRAGGDGGGGEQAGPGFDGPRQPHAAGVPSSPGFPDTLDGLCTGHLSSSLNHTRDTSSYVITHPYLYYGCN